MVMNEPVAHFRASEDECFVSGFRYAASICSYDHLSGFDDNKEDNNLLPLNIVWSEAVIFPQIRHKLALESESWR